MRSSICPPDAARCPTLARCGHDGRRGGGHGLWATTLFDSHAVPRLASLGEHHFNRTTPTPASSVVCSMSSTPNPCILLAKTWDGAWMELDWSWQGGHLCRPRPIGPSKRRVLPCTSSHSFCQPRRSLCHGPGRIGTTFGPWRVDSLDSSSLDGASSKGRMWAKIATPTYTHVPFIDDIRPISSVRCHVGLVESGQNT